MYVCLITLFRRVLVAFTPTVHRQGNDQHDQYGWRAELRYCTGVIFRSFVHSVDLTSVCYCILLEIRFQAL